MSNRPGISLGNLPATGDKNIDAFLRNVKESIETLSGARAATEDGALTRKEVKVGAAPTLTAAASVGVPTKAEFDLVVADNVAMRAWIQAVLAGAA